MRNLSLDQLAALRSVAQHGSFSAAARQLKLTQPAVSLQVRELEGRFGVALVERIGKRAFLTAAGKELLNHAERIFAAVDRFVASAQRHRSFAIGRVHVGTGTTALTYILPTAIRVLREHHPHIELMFSTGTSTAIFERLSSGDVDLGVITLPAPKHGFHVLPIRSDTMVAIFPAQRTDIPQVVTPSDLSKWPLISEAGQATHSELSRNWLAAGGIDTRPVMEFDNIGVIKSLVEAGLGAAIIPGEEITLAVPRDTLAVRELDPPLQRSIGLAWRSDRPLGRSGEIVRDAIARLATPGAAAENGKRDA